MSYGANEAAPYTRAVWYVDRLLRSATPSELPIDQPTLFDLVVNRTAFEALDLNMPPSAAPLVTEWFT